jgi:protein-L-isoaspartate(D-aspartate) O-methyltransferase
MVHAQLMARGISDERVLKAMREVPREPFIPERCRDQAYSDQPLSIGWGQTLSQP